MVQANHPLLRKNKIWIRILAVFMALFYFYTWVGISIDGIHVSLASNVIKFIFSVICNLGLWMITTEWSSKFKKTALFLYLPTLVVSPLVFLCHSFVLPIVYFIFAVILLKSFSPWRIDAKISVHP